MRPSGVLLLLGLAACGEKATQAAAPKGPPTFPVEVVVAREEAVLDAITATGQIEALQAVELRPDIEGRIVQILVTEGARVERGAALFKVDDAELTAQVARATAERDLARQNLQRTRDLLAQRAASQADLEQAEATSRSTQANLDLLELRLARTTVRAPFSGIVGQRFVSLGDYVNTNTRLVAMQTVSPARAVFQVPERYAELLQRGQVARFRVAALASREFAGRVDFIDPSVSLPARTVAVKADVANGDGILRPGMFIEVRLVTATRPRAVVVPEDAILPLRGQTFVWVVAEGTATRRDVVLGVRSPGFVEIVSGVAAGEQVVVGGLERLAEGAQVKATLLERAARPAGEAAPAPAR